MREIACVWEYSICVVQKPYHFIYARSILLSRLFDRRCPARSNLKKKRDFFFTRIYFCANLWFLKCLRRNSPTCFTAYNLIANFFIITFRLMMEKSRGARLFMMVLWKKHGKLAGWFWDGILKNAKSNINLRCGANWRKLLDWNIEVMCIVGVKGGRGFEDLTNTVRASYFGSSRNHFGVVRFAPVSVLRQLVRGEHLSTAEKADERGWMRRQKRNRVELPRERKGDGRVVCACSSSNDAACARVHNNCISRGSCTRYNFSIFLAPNTLLVNGRTRPRQ